MVAETYIDKSGREIEIVGFDEYECEAKHNGVVIGRFVLADWHDETIYLDHMDIKSAYQGSGIGRKMLECIVSVYGSGIAKIYSDTDLYGRGEEFPHLSTEGAAFLNKCRKEGILS